MNITESIVKITSDGVTSNTEVLVDGKRLTNVKSVTFTAALDGDDKHTWTTAVVELYDVQIDVTARKAESA